MNLYAYQLPLCDGRARQGLILEHEERFAEIAPLLGFSSETFEEALDETLRWLRGLTSPTLPSVRWGIECLHHPLNPVHLPLCALGLRPGFSTVKLKLGQLPLSEAIALVQTHVGKVALRLDCNRAWTLDQALEFTSHFHPSDFLYLEEPVQTFEELVAFSEKTLFPVAVDESIRSDWSSLPSLKAVVVKPTVVGTIPSIPAHLQLVLSSAYESGLGLLHIANRAANSLPIGLDTYRAFKEDLLLHPITCENGLFSWTGSFPLLDSSKLCAL